MEISSEAEKQLHENLQKCRCCFRMLIDDRKVEVISEEIKVQFQELTQVKLLESEIFADRICKLCSDDLRVFANLREDLINKQIKLYELAGLDESHFLSNKTYLEPLEYEEEQNIDQEDGTSQDFNINFETIEDSQMFDEEIEGEEFICEDTAEADEEEMDQTVIKIEKIQEETTLETDFDFFEEIVGEEVAEDDTTEVKDEIISCETCGIELSKSHLQQHILTMHQNFNCTQCNKSFQSKISLKRHVMENHNSEKMRSKRRHFCPLCPKHYDYRKQLDDHIRSYHEKERNAQCHICEKTFYQRDLKKHIEHVHGEKNVACETCGKRYTCIENLRLHMRYHLPPLYACTFPNCDKKFHQKVLQEHHERKHSTEKPVSCDQCGANFYSLRDMKRHRQRVHDKVTRKCSLCEVSFTRKDKYRQHIMKKHKELSDEERDTILEIIRNMKWNES